MGAFVDSKNIVFTTEEIKNKSKSIFDKYDFIERVYLFGSYAKNTATADSDIDIVVKLKNNVGMELYSLYDDFENNFNKSVDVLTENEIISIMPKSYAKDRVLIYEK